jgi:hypothetical protein
MASISVPYVRNVANKKYAIGAADQTAPFGMITQTVGAPRTCWWYFVPLLIIVASMGRPGRVIAPAHA